jgi:hypothetical protein
MSGAYSTDWNVNTEDKFGVHTLLTSPFHILEMHCKHPITKFNSHMRHYYLREEQSYEGNIIPIVHEREAAVGYNPGQQNTEHSCVWVL